MTDSSNLDVTPPSLIRLASVVYRFRVPTIGRKVCFVKAFKTVGSAAGTQALLTNADSARDSLQSGCDQTNITTERVISDCKRYLPLIHTILVSCKVQPDQARLDEKLVFEWKSGLETKPIPCKLEVMMYDFVMTLATQGLAQAASGTENSVAGDFAAASREYATAAGIFHTLAEDQLPKWTSKADVNEDFLPLECHATIARFLTLLFMSNGQQMAIATLLCKEGKPNYSLASKLCFGVVEQFEQVLAYLKGKASAHQSRLDPDFLTLLGIQIAIHKSLTLYYQARAAWEHDEHGVAIAMLSEAIVACTIQKRTTDPGIPDVTKMPAFKHLADDLNTVKNHMIALLRVWEKDNSTVYFASVPTTVPSAKKLKEGVQMKKKTDFVLPTVEPVLLSVPKYSILNVGGLFGSNKKTVS